ncbi:nuclear transport factor 2 family protein [Lentzea sp. JNUCC 0626]|uniref:nuclear transport factor 2 family protein n=1 Tax=Lentzea sp. JNUCC 0626 TaxID=3367513 RepID=UPI0037492712
MTAHTRRWLLASGAAAGATMLSEVTVGASPERDHGPQHAVAAQERRNRAEVTKAFARQNVGGSVYDVLDDDVEWTIVNGSTYTSKSEFLSQGAAPILDRLSSPLAMTIRDLWTHRDVVIIHFDGDATALDGKPYRNEYCWIWQLRNDKVVRCNAFLDLVVIRELIDRVDLDR